MPRRNIKLTMDYKISSTPQWLRHASTGEESQPFGIGMSVPEPPEFNGD
jgi:hypothetical protein